LSNGSSSDFEIRIGVRGASPEETDQLAGQTDDDSEPDFDDDRIDSDVKEEAIEELQKKNDQRSTINLLKPHHNFFQVRTYKGFPINIARYAVTIMATAPDLTFICDPNKSLGTQPDTVSINTGVKEVTNTLGNCLAVFSSGILSAYMTDQGVYIVELSSWTEKGLDDLVRAYTNAMQKCNFYRGKCLQFGNGGVSFVNRPNTNFDDVVIPPDDKDNFYSNTIGYITDPRLHAITRKRGVILCGPPGTGKTSIVKAAFKAVDGKGISCIFVAGDAFRENTLQDLITFVTTYLTPCIIVLEDFDLIAYDRKMGHSAIMGDLLTCLSGIETEFGAISIIGTTNRMDILDEAVTRPGRFDRRIVFDYPSYDLLKSMWVSKNGPGEPPAMLKDNQLTGAHVEEIITTAQMLAIQKDKTPEETVEEAISIVSKTFLLQKPSGMIFRRGNNAE
jgi:hypothetical protein